ncbi:glycosyltransferase family 2 protein [Glycomyces mayteni]|uniref:Glycosyltransferase family 2 protein n=1 Tax=Glycomyces mayteni TaxID=543887 RepID=A0ABW2D7B5_9ACTN
MTLVAETTDEDRRAPTGGGPVVVKTLEPHFARLERSGATLNALTVSALSGKSRLARHMLARLACPGDPGGLLSPEPMPRTGRLHCASAVALTRVLAVQPLEPWHRKRALELYDRVLDEGNEIVNAAHQGLHAELMFHFGQADRVADALAAYKNIDRPVRRALEAELHHPAPGEDTGEFLRRFQQFAAWADLDLELRDGDAPLLDRLALTGLKPVHGGQRVSILMSAYRPGPELLTAVRSVIAQSWQNWELLLVDDASGPDYDDVLAEAAGLDGRVRLLRREENGGTYAARNDALKAATGVFVTGLDSDDWAHPRWIEAQIEPMVRSREIVMTYSEGIRATADLRILLQPGRALTEIRSTSIMYRRAEVLPRLGRFDRTRKAADSEFRFRLVSAFGDKAVAAVAGRHTIVRQHSGTLSHGEIGQGWLHPARVAYESGYRLWHAAIRRGADAYLPEDGPRRVYAPRRLTEPGYEPGPVDRVFIADWRTFDRRRQALLRSAQAALAEGRTIALAHYAKPWEHTLLRTPIAAEVLAFARDEGIEFVDPVAVDAAKVVVADQETDEALRIERPDGAAVAAEALDRRLPRPPAPRRRGRRQPGPRALAALAVTFAAAAVAAAVLAGFPGPLGLALTAGGLVFACGAAALAAVKTASRWRR